MNKSRSDQGPYLLHSYGKHGAVRNSMAETESRSMIVRMSTKIAIIIVLQLAVFRAMLSQNSNWPYHLVDNSLDQPCQCGVNLELVLFLFC